MSQSQAPMKIATVFEGPGFGDQGDVVRSLEFAGLRVHRVSAGAGSLRLRSTSIPELAESDLIVLRSPWSATPDEILYSRVLAERLQAVLPLKGDATVLGVGRGALVVLASLLGDLSSLEWTSCFEDSSKWIDVMSRTSRASVSLKAFVHGRATAKVSGPFEPWLTHETAGPVGWHHQGRIWLSLVDVLSYAERAQLPEFGYADLTRVPTQSQIVEQIVRRLW